ncbi:MAG: zinc ribbon domain-containing protein [Sulfolobaceae archaeon]
MEEKPLRIDKELKSLKNKLKYTYRVKKCKFCGHKNPHNYIYCERCSKPLTTDQEKTEEWLIQKYLLLFLEKISDHPDIVATRRKSKIGKVEFDYIIELADNNKVLLYIVQEEKKIADIVNEVIDYNKINKEKIRLVFLLLLDQSGQNNSIVPNGDGKIIENAKNYDIEIEYFEINS